MVSDNMHSVLSFIVLPTVGAILGLFAGGYLPNLGPRLGLAGLIIMFFIGSVLVDPHPDTLPAN